MKKILKFVKNNILGFLLGLSLCLNGVVIAENILTANQVTYNDSTVQTELDNLFDAVDINERLGDTTTISSIGTDGTVSGAISTLNTNLSGKQATITGGASTITSSNLTASRALVSNGSGKVAVSGATSTELGYLSGVTSNVQTQLNGKAASSHNHDNRYYTESEVNNLLNIKQNASTAITTSNIGSQSVNYANSAGSATQASNVTGIVAIANGGTGANNITTARSNLGFGKVVYDGTVVYNTGTYNLQSSASGYSIFLVEHYVVGVSGYYTSVVAINKKTNIVAHIYMSEHVAVVPITISASTFTLDTGYRSDLDQNSNIVCVSRIIAIA